jgi:carboxymethylenebutenolidase
MSETIEIQAGDGHLLSAYVARPGGEPTGGLVVIQEIFGVNQHIREVADNWAKHGFLAIAPALFDRIEKHVELTYEGEDRVKAVEFMKKLNFGNAIRDVDAAVQWARKNGCTKTGVVGYCLGGTLAWLAATRLDVDVAVGYYAGGIDKFAEEEPKAPVTLHFGSLDTHIPKEAVDKVKKAHPEVQIFWYEAGHAFARNVGIGYDPEAAQLANKRSLAFLTRTIENPRPNRSGL